MAGELILIIEDDEGLAEMLRDILVPFGYRLAFAASGEEGWEKIESEEPDLIMTDLNLPGISGMEILKRLHARGEHPPTIVVTAYGSEYVAAQALRLGAWDYLAKPFKVDELLNAIRRALEAARLRRERERLMTELNQANRQLERRMRELTTFQAVGRSMTSLMSTKELLRRVAKAAFYLTGASAAAAFLPDERKQTCYLEAVRDETHDLWGIHRPQVDRYADDVLRRGASLWVADFHREESFMALLEGVDSPALLGYVPVMLGNKTIGVLGVALAQGQTEAMEAAEWRLRILADQVAIALRNAQLYEGMQRQTYQLRTLNRIARMVTSSLELDEVMRAVVRSISQILRVEAGSLVLLDEESDELVFRITLQGDVEEIAPFRLGMGQGIVGWVVQTGKPARVSRADDDPRFYGAVDRAIDFHTKSLLCVPLSLPGKVIGAIEVINKIDETQPDGIGEFTEEDEALLSAVAAFVAMAVENARLHEAMRKRVAAQTLHETVVTLSHHVNNPLQVLLGIAQSLRGELGEDSPVPDMIEHETQRIAGALAVLRELTSPQSVAYMGETRMFDIEEELRRRLVSEPAV